MADGPKEKKGCLLDGGNESSLSVTKHREQIKNGTGRAART